MLHDVFSAQSTCACSWHMPDLHRPDNALIWWADVRHNNDKISSLHQIPSLEQGKCAVDIGVGVCVQVHAEGYDAPSQIQSLPCVLLVCTYIISLSASQGAPCSYALCATRRAAGWSKAYPMSLSDKSSLLTVTTYCKRVSKKDPWNAWMSGRACASMLALGERMFRMQDSRQSTHKQRNLQAPPTKSRRASRKLYNQ